MVAGAWHMWAPDSESSAASSTLVQPAAVQVEITLPQTVVIGGGCRILCEVSNRGAVPARDVVVRVDLPKELSHRKGRALDFTIGSLEPGETRTVPLIAHAAQLGRSIFRADVTSAGAVARSVSREIEIVAPNRPVRPEPRARRLSPCRPSLLIRRGVRRL